MHLPIAAINVFVTAYSQSDYFGKLIFLGLFSLSIICWILLIQKIWLTQKIKKISLAFEEAIENSRNQPLFSLDVENLPKAFSEKIPHPFSDIFNNLKQKAIEILNKNRYFSTQGKQDATAIYLSPADLELIESHVLTTISSQTKLLDKNLFILATIITLAPFLGLLGTVWGILVTFSELHGGATASSNAAVLGGLSTALATTVLGLLIAIPALVSYSYLKNSIKNYSSDMEDFMYGLLSNVELQYRKADV